MVASTEITFDASVLDLPAPDFFTSDLFARLGCPKKLASRIANQIRRDGNGFFRTMRKEYTVRERLKSFRNEREVEFMLGIGRHSRPFMLRIMRELWKLDPNVK